MFQRPKIEYNKNYEDKHEYCDLRRRGKRERTDSNLS